MQSFAEMFEQSQSGDTLNIEQDSVITGTVVAIDDDRIIVDTGLKSEGVIDRAEFLNEEGELEVAVGDVIDVVVKAVDNGMGQTILSREEAKREESWRYLENLYDNDEVVTGIVSSKVKGGFTLSLIHI